MPSTYPSGLLAYRGRGSRRPGSRDFAYLIVGALLIAILPGCDQTAVESSLETSDLEARAGAKNQASAPERIVVPPPPRELIGVGDFVYVRRGRFKNPWHEIEPAGIWLKRLKEAPTWDEATLIAANAAQAIGSMPVGAQRQFFPRLDRTLEDVHDLKDLVDRPPKPTRQEIFDFVGEEYAGVATICFVGFDDYDALNNVPDVDVEAGAPGGCETNFTRFFVDEFVVGL